MNTGKQEALLLQIEKQFAELAAVLPFPFEGEPWRRDDRAGLRVTGPDGEDGRTEVTALAARFDAYGDDRRGWREKLTLEADDSEILALGWTTGSPDLDAGLNSQADEAEGEIAGAIGQVTDLLSRKLAALKKEPGFTAAVPPRRVRRIEPLPVSARVGDENFDVRNQAAKPVADLRPALRQEPNIGLLQMALGELATKGGLKAENVFAGFIKAAASPGSLKQGDVAVYAQGAMLEVSIFYTAFLRHSSLRASDLGMEGGSLRNAVVKMKAAFFEQDEAVRWQVAREMVTGMRLYYAEALASRGVPETEVKEMLKTVFGRDAAIANDAIAILAEPEPAKQGTRLARLLGRNARE